VGRFRVVYSVLVGVGGRVACWGFRAVSLFDAVALFSFGICLGSGVPCWGCVLSGRRDHPVWRRFVLWAAVVVGLAVVVALTVAINAVAFVGS
jgi:hypothetical protein